MQAHGPLMIDGKTHGIEHRGAACCLLLYATHEINSRNGIDGSLSSSEHRSHATGGGGDKSSILMRLNPASPEKCPLLCSPLDSTAISRALEFPEQSAN